LTKKIDNEKLCLTISNIAKRGCTARMGHFDHVPAFLSVDKNAIANPAMPYCKTLPVILRTAAQA